MSKHHWFTKKPETTADWLLIICSSIAFYLLLGHVDIFLNAGRTILGILSPFAGGIAIAYILDPIVRTVTQKFFHGNLKRRWVGMIVAYVVAILLIFFLGWMVIPQLVSSITMLVNNLPGYAENIQNSLLLLQENHGIDLTHALRFLDSTEELVTNIYNTATSWVPQIMTYVGNFASNTVAVFTALASSVYMLNDKEKLLRQLRTIAHAFLPKESAANTLRICRLANENFSGFIIGKIIDSMIIGLMTFILMSVFGMSFALLISVVIAITNIIPVFGPFIGAIPSIIILLFVDPLQALEFLVLILVIQQVDGNIIGPKILGQSIGISALWVLFSIVLGGDLFGVPGMVMGVPVFATVYSLLREAVHWCLKSRGIDAEGKPCDHYQDAEIVEQNKTLETQTTH